MTPPSVPMNDEIPMTGGDVDTKSDWGSDDDLFAEDLLLSLGDNGSSGGKKGKVEDNNNKNNKKEVEELSKQETRHVQVSRALVVVVLLMTGGMFAMATYFYLKNLERNTYDMAFEFFASGVRDASQAHAENLVDSLRALSETLTAYAILSNSTFPFVTMPMFEVQGRHARAHSGVELLTFAPVVQPTLRSEWEAYSVQNQQWWMTNQGESVVLILEDGMNGTANSSSKSKNGSISPVVYEPNPNGTNGPSPSTATRYVPLWQSSPPPLVPTFANYNILSSNGPAGTVLSDLFDAMTSSKEPVFSSVLNMSSLLGTFTTAEDHEAFHAPFLSKTDGNHVINHPHFFMLTPVFGEIRDEADHSSDVVVGVFLSIVPVDRYLTNLVPHGVNGIHLVVKNTCEQSYTYELVGNHAEYKGEGDFHDRRFDYSEVIIPFSHFQFPETTPNVTGQCLYSFYLYPSRTFSDEYTTSTPLLFTLIVAVVFVVLAYTFFVYDSFVRRRNLKVVDVAARSNAIVASMFPSTIRDRLFAEEKSGNLAPQTRRLKSFLTSDGQIAGDKDNKDKDNLGGRPIADLFPRTTVLFADIVGFTAWSLVREPTQVFTLLETLYRSFDEIAKKRRVFKVETVGDCYVAVCGLPDPRKDHAVVMARFARDCMYSMRRLTKQLEVTLGPDTGDLSMRMGLHSGPVTAGVLRGERARFQLFGDTMNTAARMESHGLRDRIQLSEETAELLVKAGKNEWITPREDTIHAKGKGELKTFWLQLGESRADMSSGSSGETESNGSVHVYGATVQSSDIDGDSPFTQSSKTKRLIDWNCEVLFRFLKQIVARRKASGRLATGTVTSEVVDVVEERMEGQTVLDEVKEIIALPKFNAKAARMQEDLNTIELDECIKTQLHEFISCIAAMYRDNPFHNFEHASHVTMSVVKLMSRIVAPAEFDDAMLLDPLKKKTLHDHTYGITSDPLTQFACVFSALIHDVDHTGVPNIQLVKENAQIAILYKGKSVAEQNSVDLSWSLLMHDNYKELRSVIYADDVEKRRFRQLVVNSVMATDITDKELKTLRNARWEKAFSDGANKKVANGSPTTSTTEESTSVPLESEERLVSVFQPKHQFRSMHNLRSNVNPLYDESMSNIHRKATIVIEHLIQASDVAHTMQHWHIYRKWNERLYEELYKAYIMGRGSADPVTFWYEGELGFFDFYIIPLAKKLKECGVFGVSSDEYLNYAEMNRSEWQARGKEVVSVMAERVRNEYQVKEQQASQHSDVGDGVANTTST